MLPKLSQSVLTNLSGREYLVEIRHFLKKVGFSQVETFDYLPKSLSAFILPLWAPSLGPPPVSQTRLKSTR